MELIDHPELMDRDTLYELRSMLALHPYFQTARLLMLQNLYLLHDPSFDEELRRAAIYVTDRKVIFQMIEAAHYQIRQQLTDNSQTDNRQFVLAHHRPHRHFPRCTATGRQYGRKAGPQAYPSRRISGLRHLPVGYRGCNGEGGQFSPNEGTRPHRHLPRAGTGTHPSQRSAPGTGRGTDVREYGERGRGILHRDPGTHLHQTRTLSEGTRHHRPTGGTLSEKERLLYRPDTFPREINNKQQE